MRSGIGHLVTEFLKRRFRLFNIAQASYKKLQDNDGRRALSRVQTDAYALLRMVTAWSQRRYTRMPWRVLFYTLGGLLYFLNPLDLIPDFIAGFGLVDDAAVMAGVVGALQQEIERFEAWEDTHAGD